jgi:uncharacterized membrane protein
MLDLWLILHFLGVALGVGTGFAMFTLGMSTTNLPPADRGAFMQRASVLSRNGSIGLLFLIVSGVGLLMTRGVDVVMAWGGSWFHIKLTLVVILIGLFGYMQVLMRKARSADGAAAGARIAIVSPIMLLVSVAIIISAVLAFH